MNVSLMRPRLLCLWIDCRRNRPIADAAPAEHGAVVDDVTWDRRIPRRRIPLVADLPRRRRPGEMARSNRMMCTLLVLALALPAAACRQESRWDAAQKATQDKKT